MDDDEGLPQSRIPSGCNYWDLVKPTYIENWEQSLHTLSIPSIDILLEGNAARRLGSNIIEYGEAFCDDATMKHNERAASWNAQAAIARMLHQPEPPDRVDFIKPTGDMCCDIGDIRAKVSEAVEKMPNGAFIRLGSRSPKDSWALQRSGGKIISGQDPLQYLLDCSERIYEDLMLAIKKDYLPHIWVRQWVEIPRWSEFRCFMKDRKLVGISQYNYLKGEVFPELDPGMCEWAVREFFKMFREATTLTDIVFDVFVKVRKAGPNSRDIEVKLLEINPFFELTDPCLFTWHIEFDGSFRYNKAKS
ncbi:MAG: hypothetical protein WC919_02725 [Candidatus Paceibacterota bacterium]